MNTVHLAGPRDADKLYPLVAAFQEETGAGPGEDQIEAGLAPLLEGSPNGAIWLIGPRMAPVGYVYISFGWSIELGGHDGTVRAFYIRKAVRGRGMGTEALLALTKALQDSGVRALNVLADMDNRSAQTLYQRAGFEMRSSQAFMTRNF